MTTILIKKKDTAGAPVAGDLTNSAGGTEIAVNTATKRIYTKDAGGNVVELGTNASASTIDQLTVTTSATLSYGTANQVQFLNGSKVLTGSANLTWDGTTLGVVGRLFNGSASTFGASTWGMSLGNGGASANYFKASTTYWQNDSGTQIMQLGGGALTLSSNLTFNADNTYDIGASGATRPRNLYLAGNAVIAGSTTLSGGTANGVMYLNGSKAVTTGSVLSFDGAQLSVNGITVGRGAGAVSSNIALGEAPLYNNVSGSATIAIGQYALFSQTTGTQNIGIGQQAANGITTGNYNLAVGFQALYANGGSASASNNTAIGYGAQYANLSGTHNVSVGQSALGALTSGTYNVALGNAALGSTTTASNNIAVGYQAGYTNQTGARSVYIGHTAGYLTTGDENTALGQRAGYNQTGNNNIAIGYEAGYKSGGAAKTGWNNILLGGTISGVQNGPGYDLTTGAANMFLGHGSGQAVTTGNANLFIGYRSGDVMTTGGNNVILGRYSGNQGGLDIRTSSNFVVFSDGDGNPRGYFNDSGSFIVGTYATGGTSGLGGLITPTGTIGLRGNLTSFNELVSIDNIGGAAYQVDFRQSNTEVGSITVTASTGTEYRTVTYGGSGAYLQKSGVTFPATQQASSDANTLDDYEEGTWTPALVADTGPSSITYYDRGGSYTKIGNVVYINVFIAVGTTFSGASGNLYITGLPFTSGGGSVNAPAMTGWSSNLGYGAGYTLTPLIIYANTRIWMTRSISGSGYSFAPASGIVTGSPGTELRFSGFYFV